MIETDSEYVMAWGIYLLAVVAAQILGWRVTRSLRWFDLRLVLQLCLFALLITPARLEPSTHYWVPAFMAALMEGLNDGSEQVLSRLWPVMITLLLLLLVLQAWRLFKSRRKTDNKPGQGAG